MTGPERVDNRPGAKYRSDEWKARVGAGLRRYHERRRAAAKVRPSDLETLSARGSNVRPELLPYVAAGASDAEAVLNALGGPEATTPQRRLLAEDFGRLGAVLRAVTARFFQTGDAELASKASGLVSTRRSLLLAIGLDLPEREVPSLESYLRAVGAEDSDRDEGAA